jgi:anion-transporting  ArsA/GET3 family ATPase
LALAAEGRRTLLMEVEGRQGIAQLFDVPPLPHAETRIAVAPEGGEVWALAVDPEDALLDYLELFYNLRRAGSALRKMGAIEFATTIAPGLRDVLLTGKAVEVVRRKDKGHGYDAVVLDAPPTGRITAFLNVNSEVSGVARVGPIHNHAELVMSVIASPRTAVHLVTLLEEMPVQETLDGVEELRQAGLPLGAIFVNMVRSSTLAVNDLARATAGMGIAEQLRRSGITRDTEEVAALLVDDARDLAQRLALEDNERSRLAETGPPVLELPLLRTGVDLGGLFTLAAHLRGVS